MMEPFSVEKLHSILNRKLAKKIKHSELETLFSEDFHVISESIDYGGVSDSFSWRNGYFSRQLATLLIDVEGKFIETQLAQAVELSNKSCFSLFYPRLDDAIFRTHIDRMLEVFYRDPQLVKTFYGIRVPHANPIATKMIKQALFLEESAPVTIANARVAVLSALFCKLRQNIGSCFATAFAIRIQEQDPMQFLEDLTALFHYGSLKRVVEGKEYIAPMNANYGLGELKKPLFFTTATNEVLHRLAQSYPLIFSLRKGGILKMYEGKEQLLQLLSKSRIFEALQKEVLTVERIFELLILSYYQLDQKEIIKEREKQKSIQALYSGLSEKKEIQKFEKSLQITKSAFVNLTDHALLKSWEFTLASFSEAQSQMAQWNLTTSLGLSPESASGIGQLLQKKIQERLQEMNVELEDLQHQINYAALQLESLQRRANEAKSESDVLHFQANYRMQTGELNRLLGLREELHAKGTQLASYFPKILQFIQEQYKECFQEIYDPEMQEVSVGILDDMPAGFRLCFKHGRSQPGSWTIMKNLDEFIRMISEFFAYLDFASQQEPEFEQIKDELPALWRTVTHVIKDRAFQQDSFNRLAEAFHEPAPKDPLNFPERVKRKPWAYISGGQIEGLYCCYYRKQLPLNEAAVLINSPSELLSFYINTMKNAIPSINRQNSYLAYSPTHAFLLYPSYFLEAWQSKDSTDLWVQSWANNGFKKLSEIELGVEEKEKISSLLLANFPPSYHELLKKKFAEIFLVVRPYEYHKELLHILSYEKWVNIESIASISDRIQSLFYEHLPFFMSNALMEKVEKVLSELSIFPKQIIDYAMHVAKQGHERIGNYQLLTAKDLLIFIQTILLGALKTNYLEFDATSMILRAMAKFGYTLFHSILVANTNWTKEYFGFLVNPGTGQIDFWRMDLYGRKGLPLSVWEPFLYGKSNKKWGIILD